MKPQGRGLGLPITTVDEDKNCLGTSRGGGGGGGGGRNDAAKRKVIKAFIKMQRVVVVCLQETKFKEVSSGLIKSLGVGSFKSRGCLRGIVIFWDSHVLKLLAKEEGQFTVS